MSITRFGAILLIVLATGIVACGAPAPDDTTATPATSRQPSRVQDEVPARVASKTPQPAEDTPAPDVPTDTPTSSVAVTGATPTPAATETRQGPTEEQAALLASLESRGAAPELHNEVWLNSEPLKLADLRGQVVLVDFWTFG